MNAFTEQDLQDYFEGSFSGNAEALKQFFTRDSKRKALFERYRLLFEVVKEQQISFTVPGMEQKLMASVQKQRERKRRMQDYWMIRGLVLMVLLGCGYSVSLLRRFSFDINALYSILIAIVVFGFLVFSYLGEVKSLKRKYNL
jgi:hypothetical protein